MLYYKKKKSKTSHYLTIIILVLLIIISSINPKAFEMSSNTMGKIMKPINKVFYSITTGVQESFDILFGSKDNRRKVELLENKNAEMEKKLIDLESIVNDNQALSKEYKYKQSNPGYIDARVIAMDSNSLFHRFIIDKGKRDGISSGQIVVYAYDEVTDLSGALVGRVEKVNDNTSIVTTIMDDKFNLTFNHLPSMNFGVINKRSQGYLEGYLLDESTDVKEGDKIITSGIGGAYTPGIYIGEIVEVDSSLDHLKKEIRVETPVDYNRVYRVFVIPHEGGNNE